MEYRNEMVNKRYIEINIEDIKESNERNIISSVTVPSLLPLNIISDEYRSLVSFNTSGFISLKDYEIRDIATLCKIIKGLISAVIESEEYLLVGRKLFMDSDMVFIEPGSKEIRLIFGRIREEECNFGDNANIIEFLESLRFRIKDKVFLQIIDRIATIIRQRNVEIKRINSIVDETEKRWYCKNLIQSMPFSKVAKNSYEM